MVLENMISGEEAERKPWHVFVYTLIVTTISLVVASWIFPSAASITFLFLITIASMPMVYKVLSDEEEEDEAYEKIDLGFLSIQRSAFLVYSNIFLGVLVASSFWYTVLPEDYVADAFSKQIETYSRIRGDIMYEYTGMVESAGSAKFMTILTNNVSVSFISLVMSFFYGVGAIFILAWNASVIAVFAGKAARYIAGQSNHPLGAVYAYATSFPSSILSIALHGIPEIAAYFLAGLAGGILSIGIRKENNGRIIKDAIALFGISVALLVAAAFIEVWITPNI